ncbi:TIGR04149 family rSAM-modified RiPP [Parabacteroides sp. PF5-9]|uniref:TIGR04149 family rSAM-modified RiPP n=1 Tax=Parabacteroides sp. PF5-9 TaxID=1742404 RepID=UPI002475904A|nr:TIGR04149 family rSAM-modified RiPP [Parabacteroides sp. PF5-9]MDH6359002.1 natural product precursor [Parabacteroides sp. PF5-9]
MKKLNKLNLKNVEVLKKDEMKNLVGGSHRCCCGMGSNSNCFDVYGDPYDALSRICPGGMGGCFLP